MFLPERKKSAELFPEERETKIPIASEMAKNPKMNIQSIVERIMELVFFD